MIRVCHLNNCPANHIAVFVSKSLEKTPTQEAQKAETMLRSSQKVVTQASEELNELFERLRWESKTQGHIIKTYFQDFDPLNHGTVTRSQFLQCIPFRDLNEKELHMILDRYTNEFGDVSYLKFHEEVENYQYLNETVEVKYHRLQTKSDQEEVEDIETEIKKSILKYRIKLDDSFRDYDRLRSGFVTKPQFIAVIGAVKFPKTTFSDRQLDLLAEKYRVEDVYSESRVSYQEFLSNLNQVFTVKGLEKFPTKKYNQPLHIVEITKKALSKDKEEKVQELVNRIRDTVSQKRISMKPVFQDFDRTKLGTFSTDHVTRSRFERCLHLTGFNLTQQEYSLLEEKYDDMGRGDVNYKMFLDDVDMGEEGSTIPYRNVENKVFGALPRKERPSREKELIDVLDDISFHSVVNRVRLEEFMRSYDPLRSLEITDFQFRSALHMGGIELKDKEFEYIKSEFASNQKKGFIRYRAFCDEIDTVITEKNMEKDPKKELASTLSFTKSALQKRGPQVAYESEELSFLLAKLALSVSSRGIHMKPMFEDFDHHKRGKVTENNFTQSLDKLFPLLSAKEFELLQDSYFEPTTGLVNYYKFLEDVDRNERVDGSPTLYAKEFDLEMSKNFKDTYVPKEVSTDVIDVMRRLKTQNLKNRAALKDCFVDYDRHKQGMVNKAKLRTALSTAKIEISEKDLLVLEDYLSLENYPDKISYTAFCDELNRESLLPLSKSKNTIEEEGELEYIMERVARKASVMQQLLVQYFYDYDKLKKHRVTKTQFNSIMDFLKFQLSAKQLDILQKKYELERYDVDYFTFCKDVDQIISTFKY